MLHPFSGWLGTIIIIAVVMTYLEMRKRSAKKNGEGYGENHKQEPELIEDNSFTECLVIYVTLNFSAWCNVSPSEIRFSKMAYTFLGDTDPL